jgi:ferrochelatase
LADQLKLKSDFYTNSFQSRLGKSPWIKPYTDDTIEKLAKGGIKKLLVVPPSFVADCLETTLEIGEEYKKLFIENGGSDFKFTESLNADDHWVEAIYEIVSNDIQQ